jgi:Lon-like protease
MEPPNPTNEVLVPRVDAVPADAVPADAEPPRPKMRWYSKVGIGFVIFVLVVGMAGFIIRVPYSTISPGEAVSLTSLVRVEGGHTYDTPRGDIRLLFVRERNHVNLWRYVQAELDPNTDVFKEKELNPSSLPQDDLNAQANNDMATAKLSATKVALEAAGYKVTTGKGVLITGVVPSGPSGKVLKPGDVVIGADGKPVKDNEALLAVIKAHAVGQPIQLGILRDGKPKDVVVRKGTFKTDGGPSTGLGVDIFPNYEFPVKVTVDTAGIGGPSGGLAMTLAILDTITPGDLTGGMRVAVTGTIDPDGNVGEIGGIEQKAVAAKAAHVKLFLVPRCSPQDPPAYLTSCRNDLARATKRAGSGVKVIPVSTFKEALAVLQANGGEPIATPARAA